MWSKKRIVWFVLMIATMAVIFYFSNQPGEVSENVGNAVAKSMNITRSEEHIGEAHTKLLLGLDLRKWAHVGMFAILGLCSTMCVLSWKKAVLICLSYSIFDEFHQLFIAGREARTMDIVIDAVGFALMILIIEAFRQVHKKFARD